jgi:endonuclease III
VPEPRLAVLLNQLEMALGSADPVPSTDGWRLVLAENVGYLVDDERRWQAVAKLEALVGLAPESILAAQDRTLRGIVIGMSPDQRVARLRRCAELAIAGAAWTAYPGIGRPGAERIELFTGARAVLALDANCLRVLTRLGYGSPGRSYAASYLQAQAAASAELPAVAAALVRAHQLLRRHGREVCTRKNPRCGQCPLAEDCPSAGQAQPLY